MNLEKFSKPISLKGENDIGILLIHGFTSTTSSMVYIGEYFNKLGYSIEIPCLKGHGTIWQDLNKVSYTDWIASVEEPLKKLLKSNKSVFIIAQSMGGALAMDLVNRYKEVKGLVLINNLFKVYTIQRFFIPIMKYLLRKVKGVSNDIKDKTQTEKAYSVTPLFAAHEILKLLKMIQGIIGNIKTPTIVFKSREDHVLEMGNAEETIELIGSKDKELIYLENSYHVASIDFDKDLICEKTKEFLEKLI